MAEDLIAVNDNDTSDFLAGIPIPVDPARIDRELSRLWKPDGPADGAAGAGSVARACLSNLILHVPDAPGRARALEILPEIGRRFPSRVIALTHRAGATGLSAWVTAVCHLTSPGAPPVCCEHITLEAPEGNTELFPGAVLPLLVPDLPVVLILLFRGSDGIADLLGGVDGVVDRLILDSRGRSLDSLERLRDRLGKGCFVGDDLAWRETLAWRRVLCDVFDEEAPRRMLSELRKVRVAYQPGSDAAAVARATPEMEGTAGSVPAALLGGWLLSRLGYGPRSRSVRGGRVDAAFERDGSEVVLLLEPEPRDGAGPGRIHGIVLEGGVGGTDGAFLAVTLSADGRHLQVEHHTADSCVLPRRFPVRFESEAALLGATLERAANQAVLAASVRAACGVAKG